MKGARSIEVTGVEIGVASNDEGATAHDPADWSRLADEEMLRQQMRERLADAVERLPEIYRVAVILRDLQGLSTEEASTKLKVKDQALKSRLHRGRAILRQQLADFAGGLSLHRATYA